MSDRVFSIDLGNSFTKVALRRGKWINSEVVADAKLTQSELKMCVPTVVAVDYSVSPPKPTFSDAAEGRRPGPKLKVFANWKRDLFAEAARSAAPPTPEPALVIPTRAPSRLESLLGSTDFLQFAASRGVSSGEVGSLQKLFSAAAAVLAPSAGKPPPLTPADSNSFKVAVLFFAHLKKTVYDVCRSKKIIDNPETIPARLCVPAFAPEKDLPAHAGVRWLAEAMTKAGWPLVAHRPIVSEPYSNAIGVLTQGSNCNRWRDMFGRSLLLTTLAETKKYPAYRAVVIDVGAFTVDFAALTYDTGGVNRTLEEVEFDRREISVPLGVTALDDAVLGVLPHTQVQYLRDRATVNEWTDFRARVFAERQPLASSVGEIGGGPDAKRVEAALAGYADELAKKATEFLSATADVPFKELILTGGGCTIPAVQDALIRGAEAGREKFRKIHVPKTGVPGKDKKTSDQQPIDLLDAKLNRAASALGGASVYFDMDREPYPMPK